MGKTKSSVRGVQNKKIVVVKGYTKKDGTKVSEHRRSTPKENIAQVKEPGLLYFFRILNKYCIIFYETYRKKQTYVLIIFLKKKSSK